VYLDSVQYPRGQSFGARNLINTPNGELYLTIPVSIEKGKEGKVTYRDVSYSDPKWRVKHLRTLEANYKKAPFYAEVYPLMQSVLEQDLPFAKNNIAIIENICNYLEISTQRIRLSDMLPNFGNKTDLIIDIGTKINANTYLCGDGGGTEYTDETMLHQHNINLEFTHFRHPVYKQLWSREFISHLSILDLLFNMGKRSIDLLANNDKVLNVVNS